MCIRDRYGHVLISRVFSQTLPVVRTPMNVTDETFTNMNKRNRCVSHGVKVKKSMRVDYHLLRGSAFCPIIQARLGRKALHASLDR